MKSWPFASALSGTFTKTDTLTKTSTNFALDKCSVFFELEIELKSKQQRNSSNSTFGESRATRPGVFVLLAGCITPLRTRSRGIIGHLWTRLATAAKFARYLLWSDRLSLRNLIE